MTNRTVFDYINTLAPFDTAEDWDNAGWLVGNPDSPVEKLLVTLDVTPAAIQAAKKVGATLIVSHHPVIFSPLKSLSADSLPYALAAANIAVISAHTNLDKAIGGVNDTLAAKLELTDVKITDDGLCRIGRLSPPTTAADFAAFVGKALGTAVRTNGGDTVGTVAVCGGSGGDFILALADKVDAFVTGEVRHHEWLTANARELTVIEAGHYATEVPVVKTLAARLAEAFPTVTVTAFTDSEPYTTILR